MRGPILYTRWPEPRPLSPPPRIRAAAQVTRARALFAQRRVPLLLYTERAHFYHRYTVRGIRVRPLGLGLRGSSRAGC